MTGPGSTPVTSQRITRDAEPIENTVQNDRCHACGMGLCDPREYHPQVACDKFTETHDSRQVWSELWRRIRAADDEMAGAARLHGILYGKATSGV